MNTNASQFSSGCVNFSYIKEDDTKELLRLLVDKCPGSKVLVWDEVLIEKFNLIAKYSVLKEHGVENMCNLRPTRLPKSSAQHVIFFTRPVLSLMDIIATCIKKEEEGSSQGKEYHIFFVPWKSFLCTQRLEELGVYGSFRYVEEFQLDVIALDSDILSMEYHTAFCDLNLDGDNTPLFLAAKAIVKIQKLYGIIPTISGKGKHSQQLCNLVQRMMAEESKSYEEDQPQIDRLLIIDRSTDLITPMLTQLTYEGLIDEAFSIKNTTILLPPEKFSDASKSEDVPTEKKKLQLTSADGLYGKLRDCNFSAVGLQLKNESIQLNDTYEQRKSEKLSDLKQLVHKIPKIIQRKASLSTHLNIAELIKEFTETDDFGDTLSMEQEITNSINTDRVSPYIEECIFQKKELPKVLRLLCLQSICNNGLKTKVYDYYKREIIQSYGYKHLITLNRLESCGLFGVSVNAGWNYNIIRKSLRLTVTDVNEREPQDISYAYSGYAPLSVRLAEILSSPGWRSIEEVLRILPGPTVSDFHQFKSAKKWRNNTTLSTDSSSSSVVTLVFFIGGVTYAEISALRFLTSRNDGYEYLVATTSIINGRSFLNDLIHSD